MVSPIEPSSSLNIPISPSPPPPIPTSQFIIAQDSPAEVAAKFSNDSLQVVMSIPPMNLHPMQTQSKSGIFKKKAFIASLHNDSNVDFTQNNL